MPILTTMLGRMFSTIKHSPVLSLIQKISWPLLIVGRHGSWRTVPTLPGWNRPSAAGFFHSFIYFANKWAIH